MSGPYPPPGYPRPPEHDGWWGGQQGPNPSGPYNTGQPPPNPYGPPQQGGPYGTHPPGQLGAVPPNLIPPNLNPPNPNPPGQNPSGQPGTNSPGQFGEVANDFPTIRYSGLTGQPGGWGGEPPRKRRSTGRIVVAVISVLVIIGGVATGIILINNRHGQPQAAPSTAQNVAPPTAGGGTSGQQPTTTPTTTAPANPGAPNGSTTLNLTAGACVTAQVTAADQYNAVQKVTCGTAQSDLMLAVTSPDMAGCPDRQYLRLSAPNTGVDCFTLDIKQGDCVDNSYLKAPCATAQFVVLRTEAGPGSSSSCMAATGATHWVPVGRNPVLVGCLGPTKNP